METFVPRVLDVSNRGVREIRAKNLVAGLFFYTAVKHFRPMLKSNVRGIIVFGTWRNNNKIYVKKKKKNG